MTTIKVFLNITLWLLLRFQCQYQCSLIKSQEAFPLALDPLRQTSADLNKAKDVLTLIEEMIIKMMMMMMMIMMVIHIRMEHLCETICCLELLEYSGKFLKIVSP